MGNLYLCGVLTIKSNIGCCLAIEYFYLKGYLYLFNPNYTVIY